ncbi:PepSY domain-containing protein [Bacillus dakarensis]|uniref:PepSY domain-containing protein n=1 Tax=Robertmurraya dakarensis TaxID=1926278 RepID=UPI0009810D3A|nr:PepSY domain-containing protein [Bacillus dakarensis]
MNWKSFLLGLGVGIMSGYATKELLSQKTYVSPEKALANAKAAFKQAGPISGSWIQMKPESYVKQDLLYTVYKGGISRSTHNDIEQFEFIADAHTGSIIETVRL